MSASANALATLDATAQAELVRKREVSASELVEAAIERIEALNPRLNALTCKSYDEARASAARVEPEGLFAGVPFLIKDLIGVAGVVNTAGCRALADFVGQASPPLVRAWESAGLIPLGLTNTPEFGLIDTTEPVLHGPTRNPWDVSRSPAGSSGGSGAAVASGMVPMAHASDGGGSIRLPASHNGLFGLKPSHSRCLDAGVPPMPFGLPDLGVEHVLTRSVRDSAAMLAVTEDPATALGRVGRVTTSLKRKLRIGLIRPGAGGALAEPAVDEAVLASAKLCETLGHHVEETSWPFDAAQFTDAFIAEWQLVAAGSVAQACAAVGCAADAEHFEPWTLELAGRGAAMSPERLGEVAVVLAGASLALARFFETYDVLLSPVMAHPPKKLGEHATHLPFDELFARVSENVGYTPPFNAAGAPAMSVPLAWTDGGLPVGSQFGAAVGGEGLLLSLAYQLEEARPWAGRRPPVSAAE